MISILEFQHLQTLPAPLEAGTLSARRNMRAFDPRAAIRHYEREVNRLKRIFE